MTIATTISRLAGGAALTASLVAYAAEPVVHLPYRSGVEIDYEVTDQDSAGGIAQRLLREDIKWHHIEALNGLTRGAPLVPGQTLRVPVTWLKYGAKYAAVRSISGAVRVNGAAADQHSKFTESDEIETGADGVVTVVLPDGTEMKIAPSSVVRIERLRQYFDGRSIDARLRLERGEIESDSPDLTVRGPGNSRTEKPAGPAGRNGRDIRIRTPKATAAVRGTRFRINDLGEVAASSVLDGKVNFRAADRATDIPKGFGASARAGGALTEPEELLPATRIQAPATPLTTTTTRISFEPVTGAVAYRVLVAANTNFSSGVSELTVTEPAFDLQSERDGNYFVAVRGLSKNGIGGYDAIGKVTFLARPLAPDLQAPQPGASSTDDALQLRWQPSVPRTAKGKPANQFRLQVAADRNFDEPLLDTEVDANQYTFRRSSDQKIPLRRFWRVASVDGWTTGPFGSAREMILNTFGPSPSVDADGNDSVLLQWERLAGAQYQVTLRDDAGNSRQFATQEPRLRLDELAAGRYRVSVVADFPGTGLRTEPSQAVQFDIASYWKDGVGGTVGTNSGPLQPSQ